jgi:hypothetical protein
VCHRHRFLEEANQDVEGNCERYADLGRRRFAERDIGTNARRLRVEIVGRPPPRSHDDSEPDQSQQGDRAGPEGQGPAVCPPSPVTS